MKLKAAFTANIYLLKVSNRKRCEICPKLTTKSPERRQWLSSVSIVDFEQVNVCWVALGNGTKILVSFWPEELFGLLVQSDRSHHALS